MNEIYTPARERELERARRLWHRIALGVFLAGLAACVTLCVGVTTENADRRRLAVVCVAVLSGWIAITLRILVARPLKAKAEHVRGILAGDETEKTGVVLSVGEKIFLPRSVTIRKVRVLVGETEETLNILADRAGLLPEPGKKVTLKTVRSYITGTGDRHE